MRGNIGMTNKGIIIILCVTIITGILYVFYKNQYKQKNENNMNEKNWSVEYIKKMCKQDYNKIFEPMEKVVKLDGSYEEYECSLKNFTASQRLVFAVCKYLMEVYNGGHDQFFYNSSGIMWKDVLDGLQLIEYKEGYENYRNVIKCFNDEIPFDRLERQQYLETKEEELSKLDYYDDVIYNNLNFDNKIIDYIYNHPDEFTYSK